MFGYVLINKEELKFKEYDVYKSYYCGLCQTLNNRSGRFAQLTLNYDMTFFTTSAYWTLRTRNKDRKF